MLKALKLSASRYRYPIDIFRTEILHLRLPRTHSYASSTDKHIFIVETQKIGRRAKPLWQSDETSIQLDYRDADLIFPMLLQCRGCLDSEIWSHRNQTLVERSIMNCRKTEAVRWIQPIRLVLGPGHNVAGDKQSFLSQTGHTASTTVATQYCSTKESLLYSIFARHEFRFADKSLGQIDLPICLFVLQWPHPPLVKQAIS